METNFSMKSRAAGLWCMASKGFYPGFYPVSTDTFE